VPGWYCSLTGWYLGSLLVANQVWIVVLSYYLFKLVVRGDKSHIREQILPLVCWGIPMTYHFLPLLGYPGGPFGKTRGELWGLSYGPREAWCYIRNANYIWLNLFLAVPAMVAFVASAVLYAFVIRKMNQVQATASAYLEKTVKAKKQSIDKKNQRRLLGYPAIFFVQWICLCIEFILVWAGANEKTLVIADIATVATINISGFLNCIWFVYFENLVQKYQAYLNGQEPFSLDSMQGSDQSAGSNGGSSASGQSGAESRKEEPSDELPGFKDGKEAGEGRSHRHRHRDDDGAGGERKSSRSRSRSHSRGRRSRRDRKASTEDKKHEMTSVE